MGDSSAQTLQTGGLRVTPARRSILGAFSTGCQPLSAAGVLRRLRGRGVNQVTVYRALASLERVGILRRVDLRQGEVCYELASHHHHHLVCTACGRAEQFGQCGVEGIAKRLLRKSSTFSSLSDHSLELFGVCKMCAKKSA